MAPLLPCEPSVSSISAPNSSSRSEEHTSELQSQSNLVCRLLLEKKKIYHNSPSHTYKYSLSVSQHHSSRHSMIHYYLFPLMLSMNHYDRYFLMCVCIFVCPLSY